MAFTRVPTLCWINVGLGSPALAAARSATLRIHGSVALRLTCGWLELPVAKEVAASVHAATSPRIATNARYRRGVPESMVTPKHYDATARLSHPCRTPRLGHGRPHSLPERSTSNSAAWVSRLRKTFAAVCAELDVIEVKVDESDNIIIVLRMTLAQHKAYRAGHFLPRYTPGTSMDVVLNEDGHVIETYDVTDQGI